MSAQSKLEQYAEARQKLSVDSPARQRINMLLDQGTFVEIDGFVSANGASSGVVCGHGIVSGRPVYVFAQDSSQDGGAVGAAHATKIAKLYDLALKTGAPVVGIYDSNGARVSEGAGALQAYGEMLLNINSLSGVVPQISLVLGICAGTSAMLACSADFVVMSEKAEFFMACPEQSETSGAGSAENAALAGVAHIVKPDEQESCEAVRQLLAKLPANNLSPVPFTKFSEPKGSTNALKAACNQAEKADYAKIVKAVCDADSAQELLSTFGTGAFTALATMGGLPCGVVATKGEKLCADTCAKIAKLVSVCDAYQIPVLTFVNTSGFVPSAKAELCGSVREAAKLAHVYAEATTPKVAVITGEAFGSAYVALASRNANADYTVAWPTATIAPLEPCTMVTFLESTKISKDVTREQLEQQYRDTEAAPLAAAQNGYIDDVIDAEKTRAVVLSTLELLHAKRTKRNPKKHSNIPL